MNLHAHSEALSFPAGYGISRGKSGEISGAETQDPSGRLGISKTKPVARKREQVGKDWEFRIEGISALGTQALRENGPRGTRQRHFPASEDQEMRSKRSNAVVRC